MKKPGANGFTLMEVMITVAIIGILATIAYPSYTNYVTAARRSDSTINLTRIAALQEKFFTQCGTYANNLIETPVACGPNPPRAMITGLSATGATSDGYYTITVAPFGPAGILGGYTLTATPAGTQATADVGKCATIAIDSTGVKSASGSDSLLGPNGGKCWKK